MSEAMAVLKQLKKDFGENAGAKGATIVRVPRIPTGIFPLDLGLGGGFPLGRISEIYGPEGSGKTTLAYLIIAHVQRVMKKVAVFVDIEGTFDAERAEACGVILDDLIKLNPDTAEQCVDMVEAMLYAEDVGIVVLDSIAAMATENEINSGAEKMIVGGSAMIVSKMTKKITIAMTREAKRGHFPAMVGINQVRIEIGKMYGDPEKTPGGNGWRFACSLRVRIYSKDEIVGAVNKTLPTFKDTSIVVKKFKVPIVAKNMEYKLCMIAHDNLQIGQAPSWNTVANRLKAYGLLAKKDKGGWSCFGVDYKTLDEIKVIYDADYEVRAAFQKEVIDRETSKGGIVQAAGDVVQTVDMETGEVLTA